MPVAVPVAVPIAVVGFDLERGVVDHRADALDVAADHRPFSLRGAGTATVVGTATFVSFVIAVVALVLCVGNRSTDQEGTAAFEVGRRVGRVVCRRFVVGIAVVALIAVPVPLRALAILLRLAVCALLVRVLLVRGLRVCLRGLLLFVEVRESDVQAGAVQVVTGSDDVVVELRRQHVHRADAGATVDRHGVVDRVAHDRVVVVAVVAFARVALMVAIALAAATAAMVAAVVAVISVTIGTFVGVAFLVVVGRRGERVDQDLAGDRVDQRRGLEREQVVTGAALEPERGMVAVHEERVVPGRAVRQSREVGARAHPALGRVDGGELVFDSDVRNQARCVVRLAELEQGVARPSIEGGDRAVAVHEEVVVVGGRVAPLLSRHGVVRVGAAVDEQAGIDVLVVVNALDVLAAQVLDVVHGAVQEGDERRRERAQLVGDEAHAAHQERVRVGRAVDRQCIDAAEHWVRTRALRRTTHRAAVEHVDDVVVGHSHKAARGVDDVGVVALLAVEQ